MRIFVVAILIALSSVLIEKYDLIGAADMSSEKSKAAAVDEFAAEAPPLFAAISSGDASRVSVALSAGADPNSTFRKSTALGWALNRDICVPAVIGTLLQSGANIEEPVWPTLQPPLSLALSRGHKDCAFLLISKGANILRRNSEGGTMLIVAVVPGMIEVVDYLLTHGVDVNARPAGGWSALMMAAFFGDKKIVDRLLTAGANACVREDRDGLSAADLAAKRGFYDLAALLQKQCDRLPQRP